MNDGKKKNVPLLKTNPISNIFIDVDHYGDFTECVITDFCIFFCRQTAQTGQTGQSKVHLFT